MFCFFLLLFRQGEFIEIADLWGDHYGLSLAEVERNASKGLATVTHMELDVSNADLRTACSH